MGFQQIGCEANWFMRIRGWSVLVTFGIYISLVVHQLEDMQFHTKLAMKFYKE